MVSIRRCCLVLPIYSVLHCTDCFILFIILHCSKLHKVDQWLEEYVGREELLYSKLVKKYTPHRALSPERHSSDNAITSNNSNNSNNYSYSNDNTGATAGAGRADGGTGAYNTDYNNDYNNDNYSEAIDYYEQEDADEQQYGQQYTQQQQQQQRSQPETPDTAQQSQFNGNSMMSPATPITPANPWAQFEQVCFKYMLACLYLGVHSIICVHQRVIENVASRVSSAGSSECTLARQLLLCLYCSKHKHLVRVVYLCIMRSAQF
jgi:hypothetical protein